MIAIIDFLAQLCLTKFIFAYIIPNEMIENKGTFIEKENLYFVVLIDIISEEGLKAKKEMKCKF